MSTWLLTPALGDRLTRLLGSVIWLAVIAGFIAAGVGLFGQHAWWRTLAIAAAGVSLLGLALFVSKTDVQSQLCAGVMDAAILVSLLLIQWPSVELVGA